ncbi:MAG: O-antigen ligase family protein [bacterium]|nr:O-antigen ligase family protein [bacterium]MDZ4247748.1 O-antigen ligase family protein [Patescibacteria group bacterium]
MKTFWRKLGANRPERLVRALLLLVVFLLPIGSVLILSEARSEVAGARNSFAVPVLYAIELLIVAAALLWARLRPRADGSGEGPSESSNGTAGLYMPLLGLIGLAAAATLWAPWPFLAGIGLVHLFVAFLFVYVLAHEFRDRAFFEKVLWTLTAGAAIQAVWGIGQFLMQRDFGLWWLGESDIAPGRAGVAKLVADGDTYVRAYGSLPHPNLLAAYLSAAAFWVGTVVFWKDGRSRLTKLGYVLLLGLLGAGLLVTFSRVAIVATLVGGALVALFSWRRWKRLPWPAAMGALVTLVVALALTPYWQGRTVVESARETGVSNRTVGYGQAAKIIADQPLGVGAGNFVLAARSLDPGRPAYQYQPVHAVPLLVLTELGVLGGAMLLWFAVRLGRRFHDGTRLGASRDRRQRSIEFTLFTLTGVFTLISLTDHFFWSLSQGMLLGGVLVAALIATASADRRPARTRRRS